MKRQIVILVALLMLTSVFAGFVGLSGSTAPAGAEKSAEAASSGDSSGQSHNYTSPGPTHRVHLSTDDGVKNISVGPAPQSVPVPGSDEHFVPMNEPPRHFPRTVVDSGARHAPPPHIVSPRPRGKHVIERPQVYGAADVRALTGHISTNTTWSGTVYLKGNIIVDPGVTLQVLAGAQILFEKNSVLYVDGTLDVEGTATSPVLFTNLTASAPGFWGGVQINETATAVVNYANISYASYAIYTFASGVKISNTMFWQDYYGVFGDYETGYLAGNMSLYVHNSTFKYGYVGIFVYHNVSAYLSEASMNVSLDIANNTIFNSSASGIYIHSEVNCTNSTVPWNAYGNLTAFIYNNNISQIFSSYGAVELFGTVGFSGHGSMYLVLRNNILYQDKYPVYSYVNASGLIPPELTLTAVLDNNTMTLPSGGIGVEFDVVPHTNAILNATVIARGNTVQNGQIGISTFLYTTPGGLNRCDGNIAADVSNNRMLGVSRGVDMGIFSTSYAASSSLNASYTVTGNNISGADDFNIFIYGNASALGAENASLNLLANVSSNYVTMGFGGIVGEIDSYVQGTSGIPKSNMTVSLWNNTLVNNYGYGSLLMSYTDLSGQIGFSNISGTAMANNITSNYFGLDLLAYDKEPSFKGAYLSLSVIGNIITNNSGNGVYADNVNVTVLDNYVSGNAKYHYRHALFEDFSTWLPVGWVPYSSTPHYGNWEQSDSNNAGGMAPEADFVGGTGTVTEYDWLVSPYLDTSGYLLGTLTFDTRIVNRNGGYTLYVETYDGSSWHQVWSLSPTTNLGPGEVKINLDQYSGIGASSFRIAFIFSGEASRIWNWYIDNVSLSVSNPYSWAGVYLSDGSRGRIGNNDFLNDAGYGLYTDSASFADWNVTGKVSVENDSVLINGNLSVSDTGVMHIYNSSLTVWDVGVEGMMAAVNSTHTIISHNVTVAGVLYLNGTRWEINGTTDGEYHIEVLQSGSMVVQNLGNVSSLITSATPAAYQFWVDSGSTFRVYNSEIQRVGWAIWNDSYRHIGLWIATDDAVLQNATISEGYTGLVLYQSSPSIRLSTITGMYIGIYGEDSSSEIVDSSFSNAQYGMILNHTSDSVVNNTVTGTLYGIYIFNANAPVIKYNNISGCGKEGIFVGSSPQNSHVLLYGNNITYSRIGVFARGDVDYTIAGSNISSNDYGVVVEGASELAAGVSYSGDYQLVYLPFGVEQINRGNMRNAMMYRMMRWFGAPSSVLVVDEANNPAITAYYNTTLNAIGYGASKRSYWNVATQGTPPENVLVENGTVVWFTGAAGSLSAQDRSAIAYFLGHGGKLLISSPDLGVAAEQGGWTAWYEQWLRARYVESTEEFNIVGTGGSASDDLHFSIYPYEGTGAGYSGSEAVEPYNGSVVIYQYSELSSGTLTDSVIMNNNYLGVSVNYSSPSLLNNRIVSTGVGVQWRGVAPSPVMVNNTMVDDTYGLYLIGRDIELTSDNFHDNNVSANSESGIYATGTNITLKLTGNRNIISDNGGDNIYLNMENRADVSINNDLSYAGYSAVAVVSRDASIDMWNSTLQGNGYGIYVSGTNATLNTRSLIINGSKGMGVYLIVHNGGTISMNDDLVTSTYGQGVELYSYGNLTVAMGGEGILQSGTQEPNSDGVLVHANQNLSLTMRNSEIQNSTGNGLRIYAGNEARVNVMNSAFSGNSYTGARMFADKALSVALSGNMYFDNGKDGLYLGSNGFVTGNQSQERFTGNGNNGESVLNSVALTISSGLYLDNANYGIYLNNANGTTVTGSSFEGNIRGMYVVYSYHVSVSQSDFRDMRYGMYVMNSRDVVLSDSVLFNSTTDGIYLYSVVDAQVASSTISYASSYAVYAYESQSIVIRSNIITSNKNGVYVLYSQSVQIYNNTVSHSSQTGIILSHIAPATVDSNMVEHNYLGLYLSFSQVMVGNNTVVYNLGSANSQYTGGLWIEHSKVTMFNNMVAYNILYGVYSDTSSNVEWKVTGRGEVISNPVYMAGNITVMSGGTMRILNVRGHFPDGTPIGMYIRTDRANQYGIFVDAGATLIVENTYIATLSGNPYLFEVHGSMLMDGSLVEYPYVVAVYSSNVLIKGTTIRYGWLGGVAVYGASPRIESSNIYSNTYFGIMLANSKASVVSDTIHGNRVGVLLNASREVALNSLSIYENDIGVRASNGSSFTMVNSTISSVENDLYLMGGSTGTLLNTHFDQYSPVVEDSSRLSVKWFLNITVVDREGNPVSGAQVRVADSHNSTVTVRTSDAVGSVPWIVVTEYIQSSSGKSYRTPNMVYASWKGQSFSRGVLVTSSRNFTIQVGDREPVITSTPVFQAVQGQEYRYSVVAKDPDGDTLMYSLVSAPAGMVIDNFTGLITWTPNSTEVGTYYVLVQVSDGHGGYAEQGYNLTVKNVNDPPVITSTPVAVAKQGQKYIYNVVAYDPDGDALTYTLVHGPAGMSIEPQTGMLTWTPGVKQYGVYNVTVMVSDGHGGYAEQSFNITVEEVNHAPVLVDISVSPSNGTAGDTFVFTVTYVDPDGDSPMSVSVIIDGKQYSMTEVSGRNSTMGIVYVYKAKLGPGAHVYSFFAEDSRGAYYTTSGHSLYVNEPPSHLWDYLLAALLAGLIALVILDIYFWRKGGTGKFTSAKEEKDKVSVTLDDELEDYDEDIV